VPSLQREAKDVYANPNGTFTAEFKADPVRLKRGSRWMSVDTRLEQRSDGTVAPVATGVELAFSGGGADQPLVRLTAGGREVALRWTSALPNPILEGDTAIYREILPGVDLRMRATARGFSKVFVIKSREAAANPKLAELRFGLITKGVTVKSDEKGNAGLYDHGKLMFGAGAPAMWDSSRPEPMRGVGDLRWGSGHVTLSPDMNLLRDERLKFPLFLDPSFSAGQAGWGLVFSGYGNNSYWGGDGENIAKVGYCGWAGCNSIRVARSYFRFDVSALSGKNIISAQFNAFETYAPSCSPKEVIAYNTNPVGPGTTWNNQPPSSGWIELGRHTAARGYSASCPAAWLGFSARTAVVNALSYSGGVATIMLKAGNEDATYEGALGWKKFAVNPTLSVDYNSYPNQPSALSTEGKDCASAPDQPYVNPRIDNDPAKGPRGPQLAGTVSDPDGGLLNAQFEWYRRNGVRLGVADVAGKASGSVFTADVPATDAPDGAELAYRVRGGDGVDFGPWSRWCDVTIDRTAPSAPPAVSSTDYPECAYPYNDCPTGGGIGRTGAFTFGVNGVDDVVGFQYDSHDQPQTYVAVTNGTATAQFTPPGDGPMDLYVRSVDRAGNLGPIHKYHFWVGAGDLPVGHWRLEGRGKEAVVRDDSPNHHDGSLGVPPVSWWWPGRHGQGLRLDGTSGAQVTTTNGPTVDTTKTFAVSAWARLDRIGGHPAIVSQDSNRTAAFQLQANPDGRWVFATFSDDVDHGGTHYRATSATPVKVGAWTHLLGTYDAASGAQRLYVNGRLEATVIRSRVWRGTGPLTIGRSWWFGTQVDFWPGTIDEVRVYDRGLSAKEIHDLAGLPANEEAFLPLDEGTGTTTVDVSGNYHVGTLDPGVSWTSGRVGPKAVRFDGGGGSIGSAGPTVRTDGSFTVTAWARSDLDGYTGNRNIVSQDGDRMAGFYLQHREGVGWTFKLLDSDTDNSNGDFVSDPADTELSSWVHLAGVYDAADQRIRLYVDGALKGSKAYTAPRWNAAGRLRIGNAKWNGALGTGWKGVVDDVHVWTGVRTDDQVRAEYLSRPIGRTSVYTGQLSRYWSDSGYHVVTTGPVPRGAYFELSLGFPAPVGAANTRTVYSCRRGATSDYFLSIDATCEGMQKLGVAGPLYTSAPDGIPTLAIYRCAKTAVGTHFASWDSGCAGYTNQGLLGYSRAYSRLIRHYRPSSPIERASSTSQMPGEYVADRVLGMTALTPQEGTSLLMACREGDDLFTSRDMGCEGKTAVALAGHIWSAPPVGVSSAAELFRCRTSAGERFDSLDPACEGETVDRSLGYVVTAL
jgi:hypothetical protein